MPEEGRPRQLRRREFIRAGALAAGAAALVAVSAAAAKPRDVPRNRTLTLVWSGREGRASDYELWNPYAIGPRNSSSGSRSIHPRGSSWPPSP
jgi:hypothetical protein